MWPAAESKWAETKQESDRHNSNRRNHHGKGDGDSMDGEEMRAEVPMHNLTVLIGFCAIFSLQQILSAVYAVNSSAADEEESPSSRDDEQESEEEVDVLNEEKVMLHEAADAMDRRSRLRQRRQGAQREIDAGGNGGHCGQGLDAAGNMTVFETICLVIVVSWHTVLEVCLLFCSGS